MALNLSAVRIIVYDLDGTVYDDIRHFELYAREIQSHLPEPAQDSFWRDYEAVVGGKHPALRIGTFYDSEHDLILETKGGRVQRALHWDGSEIPPLLRQQLYPGPVAPDHRRVMSSSTARRTSRGSAPMRSSAYRKPWRGLRRNPAAFRSTPGWAGSARGICRCR